MKQFDEMKDVGENHERGVGLRRWWSGANGKRVTGKCVTAQMREGGLHAREAFERNVASTQQLVERDILGGEPDSGTGRLGRSWTQRLLSRARPAATWRGIYD